MEEHDSENVRPTTCSRPPKRPTQTVGHARPSFVLRLEVIIGELAAIGCPYVEARFGPLKLFAMLPTTEHLPRWRWILL